MNAVHAQQLVVQLGKHKILNGIDFSALSGEVTGVMGPNGAGKSSLLRALAGLIPSTGTITLMGRPLESLKLRARACALAYLPQGLDVHWPLTVRALVSLGRFPFDRKSDHRATVDEALSRTGLLELAEENVLLLSSGERARVLLARALAVEAPILLLDEPVAALDPEHQLRVMLLLRSLAEQGRAIIVVLHDLNLAARFCHTLYLLHKGKVRDSGFPREVLSPNNLEHVYRITARFDQTEGLLSVTPLAPA